MVAAGLLGPDHVDNFPENVGFLFTSLSDSLIGAD